MKNKEAYTLWVADTEEKKRKGLSNIKSLPQKSGMFFPYKNCVNHSFTMKNVNFPLKIIFMSEDFKVIDIVKAQPGEVDISPKKEYKYVIEVGF